MEAQDREKKRVLVTDSVSWEMSGGFGASSDGGGGAFTGGARPQTVEVMRTFQERCPDVVITRNKATADFIVLFDREGGKGYARKDNKIAVFDKSGDMVMSSSTRSLGNAVKDACAAIAGGGKKGRQ